MAKMKVGCFGLIRAFEELKRYILPLADLSEWINFSYVICETTRWGGQRIVAISMRF